ncbi:MAG: hypothetical protein JKY49_13895 [Cohaesibacteraceae bacterium]|nr:hypothetical protein [Cohaesibacteraceae bacterium]
MMFARVFFSAFGAIILLLACIVAYTKWEPTTGKDRQFVGFFQYDVALVYLPTGEKLNISVPIGCRNRYSYPLGSGTQVNSVRVPYLFGVRTKTTDEAVLVGTPDICGTKRLPPDYIPLVFLAPNQTTVKELLGKPLTVPNTPDSMEFLIGYVTGEAYGKTASKFEFAGVTLKEINELNFDNLVSTVEQTVIPSGSGEDGRHDYIRGNIFAKNDPRNENRLRCYGYRGVPIPEQFQKQIDIARQQDFQDYWYFSPATNFSNNVLPYDAKYIAQKSKIFSTTDSLGHRHFIGAGLVKSNSELANSGIPALFPLLMSEAFPFSELKIDRNTNVTASNVVFGNSTIYASDNFEGKLFCYRIPGYDAKNNVYEFNIEIITDNGVYDIALTRPNTIIYQRKYLLNRQDHFFNSEFVGLK